ncbi:MAG TPA: hypothetical protein DD435_04555 [Cyanobacteria bacterium UBA8530]|nr:hypothetical protein [Cyanobacteria bacterium UBA8530]
MKELDAAQIEYLEKAGRTFEGLGSTRAGGKLFALFLITDETLSLDEMGRITASSKGTVSTNIRFLESIGIVEHLTKPGDRKDYYRIHPMAWRKMIEAANPKYQVMRDLFTMGEKVAPPESKQLLKELDRVMSRLQDIVQTSLEQLSQEIQEMRLEGETRK